MNNNKKKTTMIILGVFALVIVTTAASYAFFTYNRTGNTTTTITSGDIEFTYKEAENSVTIKNAFPVPDSVGATDTENAYDFEVKLTSSSAKVTANYNVSLLTDNAGTSNFNNDEIKYNLVKNGTYVVGSATEGLLMTTIDGFNENATTGSGVVLENQEIAAGTTDSYTLRIWIDNEVDYSGDIDTNGTMNGTKNSYTYSVKVKVDSTGSVATAPTGPTVKPVIAGSAVEKIINLSSTNTNELRIDEHAATGNQTFASTDYRYYGATPNNYVTFNNEAWRIIGVMTVENEDGTLEERVKIIRDTSIGRYSWDSSVSTINGGWGINEWSQAAIKTLLNETYYDSTSGNCYTWADNTTTPCDFTSTGLTNDAKSMISSVKWYNASGNANDSDRTITSSQAYINERGSITGKACSSGTYCNDTVERTTTWVGKVGLMYPSDYGYAADMTTCSATALFSYSSSCKSTDWLFDNAPQWTMSPITMSASGVFIYFISSGGYTFTDYSRSNYNARPVTYLTSDIKIASGTGTSSDPFILTK